MRRSQKYYRDNEREIMRENGMRETERSGAGWMEKEDGQSDNLIAQLKSTDESSIRIKKMDLEKLFYNAAVTHKTPVFIIQFLQTGEYYFVLRPCDIEMFSDEFKNNHCNLKQGVLESTMENIEYARMGEGASNKGSVRSGGDARIKFDAEVKSRYEKKRNSAL